MGREDSLQFSFLLPPNIAVLAAVLQGLKMCQGGCGGSKGDWLVSSFCAFLWDPDLKLRISSSISLFSFLHSQAEYVLFLQAR